MVEHTLDLGDLDRPLLHQLVSVDYMGYIKVTLASLSFYVSALHGRHLNQLGPFPLVNALSCWLEVDFRESLVLFPRQIITRLDKPAQQGGLELGDDWRIRKVPSEVVRLE